MRHLEDKDYGESCITSMLFPQDLDRCMASLDQRQPIVHFFTDSRGNLHIKLVDERYEKIQRALGFLCGWCAKEASL